MRTWLGLSLIVLISGYGCGIPVPNESSGIPAGVYGGVVNCSNRIQMFWDGQLISDETTPSQVDIQHSFGSTGTRLTVQGTLVSPGDGYGTQSAAYRLSSTVQHVDIGYGKYSEFTEDEMTLYGDDPLTLSGVTQTTYVLNADGSLNYKSESSMMTPTGSGLGVITDDTCTGTLVP